MAEMTEMVADKIIDCSGMLCPVPVVKTQKAILDMESGQILKMISTDPGAPPDMVAWSKQTGNEMLENREEDGNYIFLFRKK